MKRFWFKKDGFSLVELLATVVILGLLSVVAIVSVNALLKRAEQTYYATLEKNLIMAAKSYALDNRSFLPKKVGDTVTITLAQLQSKKYIGEIVDRNKRVCSEGKVTIFKYSQKDYSYKAYLVCPNYQSTDSTEGENGPIINLKVNADYSNPYFTYSVSSISDNKIISYSYQIYKNKDLVKDTGSVSVSRVNKINETKISLKDYVPGEFEIVFEATDVYGVKSIKKVSKNITPKNAPECVIDDNSTNYTTADWRRYTDPVEVRIACKDKNGKGCAKEIYSQIFSEDTGTGTIEIMDNAGVKNVCTVGVYIDNTPPDKPVLKNNYENTLTNNSYTIVATSMDKTSGIKKFQYRFPDSAVASEKKWHDYANSSALPMEKKDFVTTSFTKERNEAVEIRACDYAGNCSETTKSVIKIDKSEPYIDLAISGTRGNDNWFISAVSLSMTFETDGGSEIVAYGLSTSATPVYNSVKATTQGNTSRPVIWHAYAKDSAGNVAVVDTYSFRVDTTAPNVSFSLSDSTSKATCSDGESGVVTSNFSLNLTGSSATHTVTCENKAGVKKTATQNYVYNSCATGEPEHCNGGYKTVSSSASRYYQGSCECRGNITSGGGHPVWQGFCNSTSGKCDCPKKMWEEKNNCTQTGSYYCPNGGTLSGGRCYTRTWDKCKTITNTCAGAWQKK